MNSRLTVSDVQLAIGSLFATADFLPYLNQAQETLIQGGRWKGNLIYVTFDSSTGYITLPYEYSAIMGINVNKWVPPVFSQFHRFIESGPGQVDQTAPIPGFIMDMGDGYPSLESIPTAGSTLRIVLENAVDIGSVIRFYGSNATGEIFDANARGFSVTTTGLTTNNSTAISVLTGIEMPTISNGSPALKYPFSLYSVAPDTTATLLSRYYPPDIRPSYRRYQVGTVTASTDGMPAIQCLCQRRYIPCYNQNDWVYPGSIRAIKAAMQAVQCEDANNYDQAVPLWAMAYDTLNNIAHSSRGAARPEMNYMPFGQANSFQNVN